MNRASDHSPGLPIMPPEVQSECQGPGALESWEKHFTPSTRCASADISVTGFQRSVFPIVPDPNPVSWAGMRVLVVDDNEDARDLLDQVLKYAGAAVRLAATAREAVEALDDIDVVVTDYAMPGETGLWLLERAQERARPLPVIVVTGYADLHAPQIAGAPFARVLRKPVDPWWLCRVIREVVSA
jgi:CheY-like chemotaxis protein